MAAASAKGRLVPVLAVAAALVAALLYRAPFSKVTGDYSRRLAIGSVICCVVAGIMEGC
jgi:hypothetical protein